MIVFGDRKCLNARRSRSTKDNNQISWLYRNCYQTQNSKKGLHWILFTLCFPRFWFRFLFSVEQLNLFSLISIGLHFIMKFCGRTNIFFSPALFHSFLTILFVIWNNCIVLPTRRRLRYLFRIFKSRNMCRGQEKYPFFISENKSHFSWTTKKTNWQPRQFRVYCSSLFDCFLLKSIQFWIEPNMYSGQYSERYSEIYFESNMEQNEN